MGKLFKFELGDVVCEKIAKRVKELEGKITIRMNLTSGNRYEFRLSDGFCLVRDEKDLILADRRPSWLKKGAKVQWLGEGSHHVFVVTKVRRTNPCSFEAERNIISKSRKLMGRELSIFRCGAKDVKYWAQYRGARRRSPISG
jgi:hypothetical protein